MPIFNSKILIFLILILTLYIIIYIISKIECKLCKISTFNIKNIKNADKLKIIYISDFHNKMFKNTYDDLILKVFELNPDCIVFGGDFVDFSTFQSKTKSVKYENSLLFIEKIAKYSKEYKSKINYNFKGIFFGFGNHELRLKSRVDDEYLVNVYNKFISCLVNNDIQILDNKTFSISQNMTLSGLSLFEGYYKNLFEKSNIHKNIDYAILDKYFNNINKKVFNIMVFHKPDYCEDLIDYGFDLVLSGHNHGGLINFPFIGSILSPDLKLFPKYNLGNYLYKNKNVIVSSGIGEHFIKIRVNNKPEICLINIY